uniref:Uncharacterized protein n=1 Tax=Oryza sativa subsp. japonica TaxID=39947 RepID=Q6YXA5_ORYSJ|nr:hypothetical protein [Oryza sativa Japonica Group]
MAGFMYVALLFDLTRPNQNQDQIIQLITITCIALHGCMPAKSPSAVAFDDHQTNDSLHLP